MCFKVTLVTPSLTLVAKTQQGIDSRYLDLHEITKNDTPCLTNHHLNKRFR